MERCGTLRPRTDFLFGITPSYGKDTLEDFFRKAVLEEDGLKGQELGDAAVFQVFDPLYLI
jgi:hypothetical protein